MHRPSIFRSPWRDQTARSSGIENIFSDSFPNVYNIIIGLIAHNSGKDLEKSLSAFGKHLSKCGDRKKSKEYVNKKSV